jgi:predicted DNA binding protein
VADIQRLSEADDRRLYRVELTGAAPVVTYDVWIDLGAARLEMRYTKGRWHTRMRFPDRQSLSTFSGFCDDHGLDFRLDRLYDINASHDLPRDGLTSCQRETLQLAHERGYFTVPREATLGDLATDLGVSNQAVSERLRRGCTRLVGNLFG